VTKGIVNPWAVQKERRDAAAAPKRPDLDYVPSLDQPGAIHPVGFRGLSYTLLIGIALPKGVAYTPEELKDGAKFALGVCLAELFKEVRTASANFVRQKLWPSEPAVPKVALPFGEFTLYAAASSFDPERAERMAVDRLCMALMACTVSDKATLAILKKYRVQTLMRA
jgi:hypothetical protein